MEMTAENPDIQKLIVGYIEMFWRRRIWVIIPFLIGILIAAFLVLTLPNVYLSSTLILVEGQKVPENFVKSAVTGTVEGRLSTIRQQILSRSLLQKLIDRHNLYQEGRPSHFQTLIEKVVPNRFVDNLFPKKSSEEIIEGMRKKIGLKTIGKRNVNAFSISFQWKDPLVTMNVTNELASLFIEENLKIREQLVEGATLFLDKELSISKESLENQEVALGNFKRRYMGELPKQLDANLRTLDRFQADLLSIQFEKKTIRGRISLLETTLRTVQRGGGTPLDSSLGQTLSPLQAELREKLAVLSQLRLDYKEDYPDVKILKNQVAELESRMARREFEPLNEVSDRDPSASASLDTNTVLIDFRNQLKEAKADLSNVETREAGIRQKIVSYQKRVENVPAREQELAILLRDYENTQKNYQSLLQKKLSAKISENLEKRQKGEQFHIIDPANLPEKPISPNRLRIGFLGIFIGLGGGIALAFLREQLDTVLREPEEIEQITSFPVLATIPDFTEEMLKEKR